ncbi:lysine-specific demethylase JMJ28 isoform X3 [Populus trichocarpa]|uniref:lysine-specific demethylase JMJ28 isoform X3 n=1 Tax=Populus trichocarpa TaxID=3694 RepID=UPI002279C790|nr:lysine-specific demethylase JMJ28 isoform X3 [Populus trichocarpa]
MIKNPFSLSFPHFTLSNKSKLSVTFPRKSGFSGKISKLSLLMEPLPDHLRCKRTDGRQWRCNRRVMEDKKLCEIHHLQGRHRQYRRKVPETLKLQRKKSKKSSASSSNFEALSRVSLKEGKLGKFKKKGKKLKRGDLQLDLIRMVLQREMEKRKNKKTKGFSEKESVNNGEGNDNVNDCSGSDSEEEGEGEELMRDLPNGFMAISPAKNFGNGNVGSCSGSHVDVKVGGGGFNGVNTARRCFRSKNIEPMPVGKLQVLPNKRDAVRLRKGKRKCHWCRSGSRTLIRCLSCRKEFYCLCCIKEQYLETQEDVRMKCPVCRRTCSCKACSAIQCRDIECKDLSKERSKVDKVLHFHYLICMLLPILKQINQDQSIEIEIEAKIKGLKPTEVQIQQAEISCNKQCCCNNCKASIVDFHRTCPDCSYSLCLSCCQDIFHGSLHGSVKGLLCKCPNGRKACISGKQLSEMKSLCATKLSYGSRFLGSTFSPCQGAAHCNGSIPCPPREFGGCGGSLLDLSCIFPLSWTKELEVSAEELVGCYELPETLDVCSSCSLCVGLDCETNGIEQLQEAAAREDSSDNLLYYPTIMDIRGDNLEHFQKHWGRGQPVIVRNVLQSTSDVSWDPMVMFCNYLKNNAARSQNGQATDCLDWFEVNILAHTTDVPVSTKQLNYIRKLMTKHKEQNKESSEATLNEENIEVELHDMFKEDMQVNKKVARISWFSAATHEAHASSLKDREMFHDGDSDSDSDTDTDTEVSKFFFGPVKSSRTSDNLKFYGKHSESSNNFRMKKLSESCGAQWDVFRRQDVPKLAEYLRRHFNEFTYTYGLQKHMVHPILDQNFFLDASHKMRLKEEFKIEPWSFEQHVGEAVIIPAGCPYQIRNLKSCVSVVLDFLSPENVTECIQLIDELRQLPENHKAKVDSLEVKKMALHSISRAVKEIRELTCAEASMDLND